MSHDVLIVALNGIAAGRLTRSRTGLRFEYDDTYRDLTGATPLSVSMPIRVRAHTDVTLAPWLRGLLPDDPRVIERWARHFAVRAGSTFDLLATPIGEDCAGAVQFAPPDRIESVLTRPGEVDWLSEGAVAARLRAIGSDTAAWLGSDFTGQWSLAGAQAKVALRHEHGRWGEPRGAAATTHILKPAIAGLDDHDLNEHLCMRAARLAGLTVADTGIEHFGDQRALVVERYDRAQHDGSWIRIHQEDLCQALRVAPVDKYEVDGGPSAADIVELFRQVMPASTVTDATSRFLDALAWNWIIGGTDAHAKNYSLLLSGDAIRIAPLYDLASVLPYPDVHAPKLRLAMRLGGERRLGVIGRRHWVRVARELSLDANFVMERVRALIATAADAFSEAGSDPVVRELDRPLPPRLLDAVSRHAVACSRSLER